MIIYIYMLLVYFLTPRLPVVVQHPDKVSAVLLGQVYIHRLEFLSYNDPRLLSDMRNIANLSGHGSRGPDVPLKARDHQKHFISCPQALAGTLFHSRYQGDTY